MAAGAVSGPLRRTELPDDPADRRHPALAPAQKMAAPAAPTMLQEMAAKGVAPGVRPGDLLALLVVFSTSAREGVRAAAQKTLAAPPEPLVNGALGADLQPAVIDALARASLEKREVLDKLLAMPRVDMETVEEVARSGSEAVCELIAANEGR